MPLRKPQLPYVFAVSTCATARADGLHVHIFEGDVWSATDPICLERPDLFTDTPPKLCTTLPDPASRPAL
jgi:hypothetical protein